MGKLLTNEQEMFTKRNAKGIGNQELTLLLNKELSTSFSVEQIKSWKKRNKVSSGLIGWQKGHEPINKGTKGIFNVGGNKTSFKKGQKPYNYKPIGAERIDTRDGYILVKIQDEGAYQERWKLKHRIVWEKENGPIPKGKNLIFLDGDKTNCSIENLKLISQSQNARLNQNHWRFDNAEATEVGISLAKLSEAKAKKRR